MRIEFWFRTYSTFGGNVTLNMAGTWISNHLKPSYGGKIKSVLIELCCRNVAPPRKTLENKHERFEAFLNDLPFYELAEQGSELRICYNAVKHYHDEVTRDSQVIALKQFHTVLRKASALIAPAQERLSGLGGFDSALMAEDINEALPKAPQTLAALTELFMEQERAKAT